MSELRLLLPGPAVVGDLTGDRADALQALADLYAYPDPIPARGWVRANMVATIDVNTSALVRVRHRSDVAALRKGWTEHGFPVSDPEVPNTVGLVRQLRLATCRRYDSPERSGKLSTAFGPDGAS